MTTLRSALLGTAIAALPGLAAAQDTARPAVSAGAPVISSQSAGGPALTFRLRGGVSVAPEYFGSDEYTAGPDLGFSPRYGRLGGFEFGDPDPWAEARGFGVGGSLRYIPERDADEFDELTGMDDIDAALELGVRVGYTAENFAVSADIRRGLGGHEAWVGELGADYIARPSDRLALSIGPRLFYGSDDYADTYFGVTAAEAAASPNFGAYNPDGGLLSAGVELGARYKLSDNWGIEGAVTWEKYRNDAADSPIVRQGNDEQWGARIGLTRVFSIGG